MKLLALFFMFAAIAAAAHGFLFLEELDDIWKHFKQAFEKVFEGDDHENSCRATFEQRIKENAMHNLRYDMGLESYRRGLNKYSDMDHSKFVKHFLGFKSNPLGRATGLAWKKPLTALKLNSTVDWRNKGIVTPVKDQEQCGSCWTFSATGSLEGQLAKKTGNLVSLSEQNLVDCGASEGNFGCDGGYMDGAFMYVQKNKGIDTEISYPYTAMDGPQCLYKPANSGGNCTGHVDIPVGDENALKTAVATVGPVSVAIDASQDSFQSYKSGIYNEPNCSNTTLDHGVLVVGYGTEDGKDYWLVKNSWGTTWGIQGYIKMSRNKNNQCGIATEASYPLV